MRFDICTVSNLKLESELCYSPCFKITFVFLSSSTCHNTRAERIKNHEKYNQENSKTKPNIICQLNCLNSKRLRAQFYQFRKK